MSNVALVVVAAPMSPEASVKVTLKVRNPSGSEDTSMPVMSCVAEVRLPLPVTEVVLLSPLLVIV